MHLAIVKLFSIYQGHQWSRSFKAVISIFFLFGQLYPKLGVQPKIGRFKPIMKAGTLPPPPLIK